MRFNVMSIPTLLVFDDGEVAQAARRRQGQGRTARRSSTNSCLLPADPGSARRGRPRPATPPRRRRVPARPAPRRACSARRPRPRCAAFQQARGLRVDGVCDEHTLDGAGRGRRGRSATACWCSPSPNLRGDDVAELQAALGSPRLRLRPGRRHLRAAHRAGARRLPAQLRPAADGVCGPDTVRALDRGQRPDRHRARRRRRSASASGCRAGADVAGRLRVVVGQFGGLSALAAPLARELRAARRHGDAARRARRRGPGQRRQPLRRPRLPRLRGAAADASRRSPLLPGAHVRVGRRPRAGRMSHRRVQLDRCCR